MVLIELVLRSYRFMFITIYRDRYLALFSSYGVYLQGVELGGYF